MTILFAAACASAPPPATSSASTTGTRRGVDMSEPRRMVGTENGVRVDAEIHGDELSQGAGVTITYDLTNERPAPILVADILPETSYDPDTRTLTVSVGAEVPGSELLPRLIAIPSGGRRSFSAGTRINLVLPNAVRAPAPSALRLRVNFLGDAQPFAKLVDIPERAVHDPKLAAELFPTWVDRNETVTTNALPMRWVGPRPEDEPVTPPAAGRRRPPGS